MYVYTFLLHIYIYIYIYIYKYKREAFVVNGYRRREWIRQPEFKSWVRLCAVNRALINL